MVVRKLLACTQQNRPETSTALCNTYRRVSLRWQHAQIRFSCGACNEKPEKDRPPFCFYEESIRTSVHGLHFLLLWKRRLRNAIVGCRLRSIAVKAHRRWAASASIIYFIQNKWVLTDFSGVSICSNYPVLCWVLLHVWCHSKPSQV